MKPRSIGALVALVLCGAATAQSSPIRVVHAAETVRVLAGERLLLAYRTHGHEWKAYAEQLCTPSGLNVLRVAPPDHVHHRGLIFALGADDDDYWGEHYVERPGRQRGAPITEVSATATADQGAATFVHEVDWIAGEPSEVHVREDRRITVSPETDATLCTWETTLSLPEDHGPVRLWGRHYFGLGARFLEEMDGNGRFFCSTVDPGTVVRGDERLRRATWCAYAAHVGDREVTVAMFDHPANPRHPATWFTMAEPFALLAATLAIEHEPLGLRADASVRLCYGIALWDGVTSPQRIDELYLRWVAAHPRTDGDHAPERHEDRR